MTDEEVLAARIDRAIWEGDEATLWEIAGCRCCCDEHTFGAGCPAYQWGGCRGQGSDEQGHHSEWARFYAETRGMTHEQFYGAP